MPKATYEQTLTNAIDMSDDAAIEQIVRMSPDPAGIVERVRSAVPLQQMCVNVSNVRAVIEESCLWLVPVVAGSKAALVFQQTLHTETSPVLLIKDWLGDWFGTDTTLGLMAMLPDYFAFAALSPGQIRQTLEAMMRPKAVAVPAFHPGPLGSAIESGLPMLGFIIGSVTRFKELPSFKGKSGSADIQLQERIRATMPYISGDYETNAHERYRVGTPMPMTGGLVQGLKMWISEVEIDFDIKGWDLTHSGFSDAVLAMKLENKYSHIETLLRLPISLYQFGSDGVRQVVDALPVDKRVQDKDLLAGGVC